jgi:phosphatidylglycerol lysyltransferase
VLVLSASVWLTFFSFKHVEYSNELWWRFALFDDAPRSLRALVGATVALGAFSVFRLMRPQTHEPELPTKEELKRILPVVRSAKETEASLALLGDKALLVSDTGRSFLMYSIEGRSWVAMGDPIGEEEECRELVWRFHSLADRHGGWTVFYQVDPARLPCYVDIGLSLTKIGEEARIELAEFTLDGHAAKPIRHWHRKPQSEGCTFEIIPSSGVQAIMPEVRRISDEWLLLKNVREKRFSLGYFDEHYLQYFPLAIVRQNGRIVAFANILLGSEREELSVDLMRHTMDAPGGVMDFLFIELMLWGRQEGYRWFNMGMAPLSGLESRGAAPLWHRLGTLVYRYGEYFYNFQGLRQYKDKFHPVWTPRYLASPGGVSLVRIFANLGTLISGGAKGVIAR